MLSNKEFLQKAREYADSYFKRGDCKYLPYVIRLVDDNPEDSRGKCDCLDRTITVQRSYVRDILPHEIFHMVDNLFYPYRDGYNHRCLPAIKKFRGCGRDIEEFKRRDVSKAIDFFVFYLLNMWEVRANIFSYLYTGRVPEHFQYLLQMRWVLDYMGKKLCYKLDIRKNAIKREYDGICEFIKNPTEENAARLMDELSSDKI